MALKTNFKETVSFREASVNGVRLHCAEVGSGEPIVLLHGFPEHWYSWRHQMPALAEIGRVIAPDQRGYNLSSKPKGAANYDIDLLADDVAGLLDSIGAPEASIVGHDWGGAVAWWFAIRHPKRVKKLAVLNCPHPLAFLRVLRGFDQLLKSWYMFFFQLPWLPERFIRGRDLRQNVVRMFRGASVNADAFTDEDIDRFAEAIDKPGALTAMINYYRAAFRRAVRLRTVAPIEAPTLLIWGEQDRFLVRRNTENLDEWVKNLTVKYISDAGHWVQQERPDIVNKHLLEFL